MELKIENNKLIMNGKEVTLTDEQLKELGVKSNPFDIKDRELFFSINGRGTLSFGYYNKDECGEDYEECDEFLLKTGKICKDEDLMEQKKLRQNLNDLLWKFTNENGWVEEVWEDLDKEKWKIYYYLVDRDFHTGYTYVDKTQGTTYFISKEIAQRAIDEIVKPYMEEHPEFVW